MAAAFISLVPFGGRRESPRAVRARRPRGRPCICAAAAAAADVPDVPDVPDVLVDILQRKRTEVDRLLAALDADPTLPAAQLLASTDPVPRRELFRKAISKRAGTLAVIAEIKRKSPSRGHIATISSPGNLSRAYHGAGAAAVSVLTDLEGFGGTLDDLKTVVATQARFRGNFPGPCPVLRKDFTIHEAQIAEAAAAGAGAVLLIVAALGEARTAELLAAAHRMGLDALVEVHNEAELDAALRCGAEIVGVNNRDLRTFEVSLATAERLRPRIPDGVVAVAESGIKDAMDAWKLRDMGYNAILVGEALCAAAEDTGLGTVSTMYQPGYNMASGLIKAFASKGSTEYGNPAGAMFTGKGEGAKETLGELSL